MAFNSKDPNYQERLRNWKLAKGAHKLKNRSSKHLRWLNFGKSVYRCASGDCLKTMADNGDFDAYQEILRRDKKRDKKSA